MSTVEARRSVDHAAMRDGPSGAPSRHYALDVAAGIADSSGDALDPASAVESRTMHGLGLLAFEEDDWNLARHWWTRAASAGHVRSMVALAIVAEEDGDLEEARTWWHLAAVAGDPDAMYSLGLLADGEGDWRSARSWWRRAAAARLCA